MFLVSKAFYMAKRDAFVFTGTLLEGEAVAGMLMDLPTEIGGPGCVRIDSVDTVQFADGREELALIIVYDALGSVPLWEPSTVQGTAIRITR